MKKLIWVLLILIVLFGGYFLYKKSAPNKEVYDNSMVVNAEENSASSTASSTALTTYTLADVESHSSSSSCWSAIEGKVYDLTSWIGQHPGGEDKILSICGKDGTQAFDGKHGMDQRAKGVLPNFYLGDLVN